MKKILHRPEPIDATEADGVDINRDRMKEGYHKYTLRKFIFIIGCCIIVVIVAGLSATIGSRDIGVLEVYRIIFDHLTGATYVPNTPEWWDDYIVWEVRLPRIVIAIIAGAGLAIGGAAMQSVLKNPLADQYTTGVSSGAVLGTTLAIALGLTMSGVTQYGIFVNAFLFGLIPVGVMLLVSKIGTSSPATIILAGVAMSYLFTSLSTLILVTADAEDIAAVYLWQVGTLKDAIWPHFPLMFLVTAVGSIFIYLTARQLNLLTLGDNSARSLGLNVDNYRLLSLAIISIMAASIISYTGVIGFVGLVAPHIVRMFLGSDNRFIIPASMASGAALLLIADVIARTVVSPKELPVGLIMSFLGGILFLFLIVRHKRDVW